ncbi:MAG: rhomboid family intramembrane serine protease [Gammaproteobacteria bacterium]|nr:rhomboid family intramembrane serine protease [Gammaproteobacteria bacterium]
MTTALAIKTIPRLTIALIGVCLVVAVVTKIGAPELVEPFLISAYPDQGLREIFSGQVWRLLTPIFIHFGPLHLALDMLALWILGSALERAKGPTLMGLLVVVTGIISNLAEFIFSAPNFGGMSGVLYGLVGYIWMQGQFNPRFGIYLPKPVLIMLLGWYVLCWTGLIGPIANIAHTAGLAVGVAWGFVAAQVQRRKLR